MNERGMQSGQECFMIERSINGQPCWLYWVPEIIEFDWTPDPNKALHFADRASCDQIANEMPDLWDVRITGHSWVG